MQIQFGHVDTDPRTLDKRSDFNSKTIFPVTVDVYKPCDIHNPKFLLSTGIISGWYNYAYVPAWKSYYFLSEPIVIDGNRCTVTGDLDYLTTYADAIKTLNGYLIRTADNRHNNKYLPDRKPTQENSACVTYQFDVAPFQANYSQDSIFVLTVIGGKIDVT